MLAPRDAVLVDEDQAHRPQPELLDARDDLDRCVRLLIRVQPVPLDEPRRSQTQTLAHVTNSSDRSCLSRPWRAYGTPAERRRERTHDRSDATPRPHRKGDEQFDELVRQAGDRVQRDRVDEPKTV
jgi:hypothetical protein